MALAALRLEYWEGQCIYSSQQQGEQGRAWGGRMLLWLMRLVLMTMARTCPQLDTMLHSTGHRPCFLSADTVWIMISRNAII